jgi:hypothetical protein
VRLVALSESPADEAAIRILTEAIRGGLLDWVEPPIWRSRGWPAVLQELPIVMRDLYYHTNATGLIVVVDTNSSPLHNPAHSAQPHPGCRLCALRETANATLAHVPARPGRPAFRVALGAATPAIEAWYLCGKKPHPSEAAWTAGGARSYDKNALKREAYGTDRPNLLLEMQRAVTEATRLAANLASLRTNFPNGFGVFESDVGAL